MRATDFEFRHRFLIICILFFAAFACLNIDHQRLITILTAVLGLPTPHAEQYVIGFGALIIFLGAALRTWAAAYLHSGVVHDVVVHRDRLVADGPYRYTRNPLYLGGTLLAAGMGLLTSRLGWFVLVAGLTFFEYRLIFREEAELAATQGASFHAFRRAVPRFLPAFTPRLPASGQRSRWLQAFAGEWFMWAFALGMLTFTFTLNQVLFGALIYGTLLAYLIWIYWVKKRSRSK